MDFSLLLSSYATVWSNPEVLLMTFIGALGGVLHVRGMMSCFVSGTGIRIWRK